ncbi:MAG TPA: energy transducer TonB [Candidatus Acidoferrum sp.]|jgi:TonB family protein|nr:energy transducer TonB [Candidatus Acidoferrum sp.]
MKAIPFVNDSGKFLPWLLAASIAVVLCLATSSVYCPVCKAENVPPHASADRSGELPAGDARTFSLIADMGSVHVLPQPSGAAPAVRYTVHLETDAHEPLSQTLFNRYVLSFHDVRGTLTLNGSLPRLRSVAGRNAQFWVQFTVYVPANFSVEVHTGAGDIETGDIGGHALLVTEGGNITTGRIGGVDHLATLSSAPVAKIETQGGHITVLDIGGDLDAYTAGGFIQARDVAGNAKIRTGGGHIRAAHIRGTAQLETDGGNITVGEAGALVGVRTGGGQIDFGEVHGSVHAETGGGGVRVMYVSGPMEVETSGGGICLTRVSNVVRAATGNGTITAWITPESGDASRPVRLPGPSQLSSGTGDIVVFLPRNLAATIEASVENGGADRIEADSALGLNMETRGDGPARASGTLNGGGALLKLRSNAGKIRLQYVDEQTALRQSLLEEQRHRLAQKLSQMGFEEPAPRIATESSQTATGAVACTGSNADWWDTWKDRFQVWFRGGVSEDPEEFKKHLVNSPPPDYPQMARRAGIQGVVRLQVRAKTDGTLEVEKVIEGEPALVEAARAALRQWRVNPGDICGKKVDLISTLAFNFQLR